MIGDVQAIRAIAEELLELDRETFDEQLAALPASVAGRVAKCWELGAHRYQRKPNDGKAIWLLIGGRGAGKTRAAVEHTLNKMEDWGPAMRGLMASKTIGDVRKVMINGVSGLKACARRRGYEIEYIANQGIVRHPNGAQLTVMTSEKPDGPCGEGSNYIWGDEIAVWKNAVPFFDNLRLGHREASPEGGPESIFTTTPRPNAITRRLVDDPVWRGRVSMTHGTTYQNADNLDAGFMAELDAIYRGTKLGDQELLGILLRGLGTIIDQDTIHRYRVHHLDPSTLARRVVSLDPAATSKVTSDDSGLVVLGADDQPHPHAYVLDDRTLSAATPKRVCEATVEAYVEHDCDSIIVETNNGGEWILTALREAIEAAGRDPDVVNVQGVWARHSKQVRFEPVGALYERGRIHHVGAPFEPLEKEATSWIPGEASPNRLDAAAQGITHLLLGERVPLGLEAYLT